MVLNSSILALGIAFQNTNCDRSFNTVTSNHFNIEDTSPDQCGLGGGADQVGASPGLQATLTNNGGPTLTRAPVAGSLAIDHATTTGCPAVDQRSATRPFDNPPAGPAGQTCDVGAVEFGATPPGGGTCAGGPVYVNLSGSYFSIPGAAHDLGANTNGAQSVIWAIGTNTTTGGCGIYQYVGGAGTWTSAAGGATSITVDNTGNPWVIQGTNGNAIYRRTGGLGGVWNPIPGAALELSGGAGGQLYAIGTNAVAGGHGIYVYTGAPSYWSAIVGGADHIAVAPDSSLWAVQTNGDIYHSVGASWVNIPGKAQRVTVGYDGTIYALGLIATPGGFQMYRYIGAPSYWQAIPGGALEIIGAGVNEFWAHQ